MTAKHRMCWMLGVALLLLLPPVIARAGDDGPPPGADSPPWDGETYRPLQDEQTGISFEVPMSGFRLETRHFDPKTPAWHLKAMLTLSGPEGAEVVIGVYDDSEHLGLQGFFEKHLGYLRQDEAAVTSTDGGPKGRPAIAIEVPRGQSFAHVDTVFVIGSRVFDVTCVNTDDERAAKAYLRVLATLAAPSGKERR